MVIKVFTHTDLDGVSSYFMINEHYKKFKKEVDVTFVNHDAIDKKIINFIEEQKSLGVEIEKIYVTDIAMSEETGKFMESELGKDKLQLIDHHNTAKYLMDVFDWVYVNDVHENGKLSCATSLLVEHFNLTDAEIIKYAEYVRSYDTWDWFNEGNKKAKDFNDLMYLIGRKSFVERYRTNGIKNKFSQFEIRALAMENLKIKNYVEGINKTLVKTKFMGYNVGYVFNESYGSTLGNYIVNHEDNQDIDFVIMINMAKRRVSYVTNRDDIDLGQEVAEIYGGGGHPKAAGSPFYLVKDNGEMFNALSKFIFGQI